MANAKLFSDTVIAAVARTAVAKLSISDEAKKALLPKVIKTGVAANFDRQVAPGVVAKSLGDRFYPPKDIQLLDIVSAMERVLADSNTSQ